MTPVAVVAIADIVLIALAFAIVLACNSSQRRELRRLQPIAEPAKSPKRLARVFSIESR